MKFFRKWASREQVSRLYLDLAGQLPKFNKGPIRSLQRIQETNDRQAEDWQKKTKPPEGCELEFLHLRLIELFNIEEFEKLRRGLLKLFPALENQTGEGDFLESFRSRSETIEGGVWQDLGTIFRESKQRLIGGNASRTIERLPEDVRFIKLAFHQFLPSVIVIIADVYLTPEAAGRLSGIQARAYHREVRFKNLLPWKAWRGYSLTGPQILQKRAVLNWLNDLRAGVEGGLRPYLSGQFMQQTSKRGSRLPAIEVYALRGSPEPEKYLRWAIKARHWLGSYSLEYSPHSYGDKRHIFLPRDPTGIGGGRSAAHRLIVLWDELIKTVSAEGYGGDERLAVIHHTEDLLGALVPRVTILDFLRSIQRNVERLRAITFESMASRKRMGAYFRLYGRVTREAMLLERVALEFDQQKWLVEHETQRLTELIADPGREGVDKPNLQKDSLQAIQNQLDLLKKYLSHVRTFFSDFVTQQNIRGTYRLQWLVFWLSIIATLAAILGAIAGWPALKEFLKDVFGVNFES